MVCEEPVNYWKCGDDKSIDQKQKIYYYIGKQEGCRATVKKRKKNKKENKRDFKSSKGLSENS